LILLRIGTDSPKIYISCTEDDLEEVLDLSHALEKKGFKSSIGVFDGEVAYLKDEGLPGESLDAINNRRQIKLDEARNSSDIFLLVLSTGSLHSNPTYFEEECKSAITLQNKKNLVPFY
jgi:hypothetical protein